MVTEIFVGNLVHRVFGFTVGAPHSYRDQNRKYMETTGIIWMETTHRPLLEQLARVGGLTFRLVLFSECGAEVELLCLHLWEYIPRVTLALPRVLDLKNNCFLLCKGWNIPQWLGIALPRAKYTFQIMTLALSKLDSPSSRAKIQTPTSRSSYDAPLGARFSYFKASTVEDVFSY